MIPFFVVCVGVQIFVWRKRIQEKAWTLASPVNLHRKQTCLSLSVNREQIDNNSRRKNTIIDGHIIDGHIIDGLTIHRTCVYRDKVMR